MYHLIFCLEFTNMKRILLTYMLKDSISLSVKDNGFLINKKSLPSNKIMAVKDLIANGYMR